MTSIKECPTYFIRTDSSTSWSFRIFKNVRQNYWNNIWFANLLQENMKVIFQVLVLKRILIFALRVKLSESNDKINLEKSESLRKHWFWRTEFFSWKVL